MAIEKTVELNVETTQAQKALNKFGGTLEDVYGEGVQPLNFAIGELEDRLYEMAAAGDTSSKQFKEMSEEVGRMKKVIIDTDLVLDGMSQTTAQKVGGAVSGLASGFELAQGAMGAFGVESEAIQETLLRVQSAMAISQGIQGIREAIPSFKALAVAIGKTAIGQKALNIAQIAGAKAMKVLNAAMAANPIGLLVTGITALAGAFAIFGSSAEDAEKANEKLTRSIERQTKALEKEASQVTKFAEQRRRQLELNGATEEELYHDTLERLADEEKQRKKMLIQTKSNIKLQQASYKNALIEGNEDLARSIKEQIQSEKEKYAELKLMDGDFQLSVQEARDEYVKKVKETNEQALADEKAKLEERRNAYKQYQNDRLNALRKIQDLELELSGDEIEANNLKYERLIEDTKKDETLKQQEKEKIIASYELLRKQEEDKIIAEREAKEKASAKRIADFKKQAQDQQLDDEAAFYETYNQNTLTQAQLEEQAITDKYFNLIEKAKQYNLDTTELERKQAEELKAINDKAAQEEIKREQAKQQAKMQMASDALGAISQLVTAFAGDNEKAQERAFKINKAISIAQAVVSTAQGVMAQLAVPQDALTGANFIKAGIVATTGAAQIATIAKTKFNGSAGASSVSNINARTPQVNQQAPTFNIVGDTGINQLASTLGSSPMKAYVVAGDVTTAQSLERNKIEQSKL